MPAKAVGEWHLGLMSWAKSLAQEATKEESGQGETQCAGGSEVHPWLRNRNSNQVVRWEPAGLQEHQKEGICGHKGKRLAEKKPQYSFFVWLFVEGCGGHAQTTFSRMELLVETGVILKQLIVKSSCLKTGKFHISEQCVRRDRVALVDIFQESVGNGPGWMAEVKLISCRIAEESWARKSWTNEPADMRLLKAFGSERKGTLKDTEGKRECDIIFLNPWKSSGEKKCLKGQPRCLSGC